MLILNVYSPKFNATGTFDYNCRSFPEKCQQLHNATSTECYYKPTWDPEYGEKYAQMLDIYTNNGNSKTLSTIWGLGMASLCIFVIGVSVVLTIPIILCFIGYERYRETLADIQTYKVTLQPFREEQQQQV
jgi:hypothetical protein